MTETPEPDPPKPRKRRSRANPPAQPDDLEVLVGSRHIRFESPEEPEVLRSRLKIKENRAKHELWRDKVLLVACLVALAVLGLVSVAFLFLPGQPPESRTWATATLTAVVSGVVNYSIGRAGKSP